RSVAHRQEVKPVTEPKKQPIYYVVFFDIDYPLFVQALVIMIVRHLHTVHELLSVLSQSTPEMQTLCSELCFEGQYPSRRTWERRLKALPASLPAQIGCLGRYLVSLIRGWIRCGRAAHSHLQELRTHREVAIFYPFLGERFGPSNCMKISRLLTSNAGTYMVTITQFTPSA